MKGNQKLERNFIEQLEQRVAENVCVASGNSPLRFSLEKLNCKHHGLGHLQRISSQKEKKIKVRQNETSFALDCSFSRFFFYFLDNYPSAYSSNLSKSGTINRVNNGIIQAAEAMAKGPAPINDNKAVTTGNPKTTDMLSKLLLLS